MEAKRIRNLSPDSLFVVMAIKKRPAHLSFKICIYFNTGKIVNRRVVLP